jgi:hypothetical protein
MNLLIYFCRGVISSYCPADEARLAIWPMKVRSPVAKTTPLPVPSLLRVEKKAIFLVYRGFSFVHLALLSSSSVSPVREELSTFIP